MKESTNQIISILDHDWMNSDKHDMMRAICLTQPTVYIETIQDQFFLFSTKRPTNAPFTTIKPT
jgi:hypothetical protein